MQFFEQVSLHVTPLTWRVGLKVKAEHVLFRCHQVTPLTWRVDFVKIYYTRKCDYMKSLSLNPYWAHCVLCGEKTIECRTWKTDYRGDLLICSSNIPKIEGTIAGHALIVCTLSDIVPFTSEHFKDACFDEEDISYFTQNTKRAYAWKLTDFKDIIPFPIKGKLKLFDTDDNLIHYLPANLTDEQADYYFDRYFNPLFSKS